MPRLPKTDVIKAKKFIAELLATREDEIVGNSNTPSPKKIATILKNETGIEVSRVSITLWLKEDLSKYLNVNIFTNNTQIKEYDDIMNSAKSIWNDPEVKAGDRTKAYNSYLRAKKQREGLLNALADQQLREKETERPVYLLDFTPGSAKHKCPECGYEFYEIGEDGEGKTKSVKSED